MEVMIRMINQVKKQQSLVLNKIFSIIMLLSLSNGYSQDSLLENGIMRSFNNKISIDNNELDYNQLKNNENTNAILKWSSDSTFAIIYQFENNDSIHLNISDLYYSNSRLAIYFRTKKSIYYISGFKNLDLYYFFEYLEISGMSYLRYMQISELLNIGIFEGIEYFEKLRKHTNKKYKLLNKLYKKNKIMSRFYPPCIVW